MTYFLGIKKLLLVHPPKDKSEVWQTGVSESKSASKGSAWRRHS
jgi:hypothetical protein